MQDPLVLLDPVGLRDALLEWLPVLERVLGPAELRSAAVSDSNMEGSGEERWEKDYLNTCSVQQEECLSGELTKVETENKKESHELEEKEDQCQNQLTLDSNENASNSSRPEPVRVESPKPVPSDVLANLTELATLYTELSCFKNQDEQALGCTIFLRRYFFLLDQERVRRLCLLCYQKLPEMKSSFIEAMLGTKPQINQFLIYSYYFLSKFHVAAMNLSLLQ